jgi:hypothetical protein
MFRHDPILRMSDTLTLTAIFTPEKNGGTRAPLAEWPAVVSLAE